MHRPIRGAFALLAVTPLAAAAQSLLPPRDAGPAEHVPIAIEAALEWRSVLERAVRNYPRFIELEARRHESDALHRRSRSLFAGRPSIALGYRSDDPLDDYGLAEYETGLTLPLWRFGERQAAGRIATSASDETAAAHAALVWEIAGALRAVLWDIEDAVNGVELAAEALAVAEEIERVVARRHSLGDLPLEDTLLAESTVLERQADLIERRAALVDAEFAYETLTGMRVRPARFSEAPAERRELTASHPLLSLAAAELERARAELELTAHAAKGSPTLMIGPSRERDPRSSFYTDSLGIEISIPVGGNVHVDADTAAARRRVAVAEAELAAIERRLHADLHDALHSLETTEEALALAERRAEIAARHLEMGRTAFEQGEIALIDLLRRDEAARTATRAVRALQVQRGRAVAAVNQSVGVVP